MRRLLGIPLKGASIEHAYPPEIVEQMTAEFKSRLAQVQSAPQAVRRMAAKSIRPKAVRDTMVGFIRRKNSKTSARREAIMRQNDDRAQRGRAPRELPDFIKMPAPATVMMAAPAPKPVPMPAPAPVMMAAPKVITAPEAVIMPAQAPVMMAAPMMPRAPEPVVMPPTVSFEQFLTPLEKARRRVLTNP